MPRVATMPGASHPLLLGLFGLGGAGLVWWLSSTEAARTGTEARASAAPAPLAPAQLRESPAEPAESRGFALREASAPAPENAPRALLEEPREGVASARAEREFLAGFHALALQPGALEERAAEILDGAGPGPEKVALLRALLECRSPEAVRWLARAARTQPDEPSAAARSLASQALAMLAGEAPREAAACRALANLAFEEPELTAGLRRRAASAFARNCSEAELDGLRERLLGEPDALLVAGALASLAEREPTPRVERIRLDFPAASAPEPEE